MIWAPAFGLPAPEGAVLHLCCSGRLQVFVVEASSLVERGLRCPWYRGVGLAVGGSDGLKPQKCSPVPYTGSPDAPFPSETIRVPAVVETAVAWRLGRPAPSLGDFEPPGE